MTATIVEPRPAAPSQTAIPTEGPRKRRKRAPVAGAANDCFTCAGRNAQCDRRRPYCSTCLETGQDCAGYKTQLTWGVGVASRGKLRGLSLPVAGTKKVAEPTSPAKKKRTTSSVGVAPVPFAANKPTSTPLSPISTSEPAFTAQRPPLLATSSGYQTVRPQHHRASHSVSGPVSNGLHIPDMLPSPASTHMESSPGHMGWLGTSGLHNSSMYSSSPISPTSYSAPSHNMQWLDGMPGTYQDTYCAVDSYPNVSAVMTPTYPMEPTSNYPNRLARYEHPEATIPPADAFHGLAIDAQFPMVSEDDVEEVPREGLTSPGDALSLSSSPLIFDMSIEWTPFSGSNAVGQTPRMQYLIQYYAEVIAPVIVAFDGPRNPFRDRILNMAAKSDSLQHALSALAASNLRQRKESGTLSTGKTLPARRSSAAHLSLTDTSRYDTPIIPTWDQKREEAYHKFHAVKSLNATLADPNLLKDDAVLATLLVLCLFHICDSGIARFQTQFAGVKKLLNLRRNDVGGDSMSTKWMTRLFTLFDAMAATVNERESQFGGHLLEFSTSSDEEWCYETLAGVDGRLFKIMSQLGRLNILSQGKAVESNPLLVSRPLPFDPNHFDGNGWRRIMEDENFFNWKTMSHGHNVGEQYDYSPAGEWREDQAPLPQSEQFWREWREVRNQLQAWTSDSATYDTRNAGAHRLTEEQRGDIANISNAFRYSALLYTERLGHPTIPSNHEKIQYWVRQSLHHIKQVRSDVYLLWPLFITGSECVHEEGRNVIRERCEDIQKDSGFVNNASCLALLEKVWQAVPAVPTSSSPSGDRGPYQSNGFSHTFPQSGGDSTTQSPLHESYTSNDNSVNGFRFRNVMQTEGNEGEWIVV